MLDIGGGIGIGEGAMSPEAYAAAVLPSLSGRPFRALIEPGRAIAGPAGALLTRVLYVKAERGKTFVIVDAGMNDLLRPALYQASHSIENVDSVSNNRTVVGDVVGPVCETADFFLRDAALGRADEGDLLAIRDAGAYGFSMASNYNFRMRPAEILVENGAARLVRRRDNYEDLIRPELV
jgi:diaminopimelate decarboxylase